MSQKSEQFDFNRLKRSSLESRASLVKVEDFAKLVGPEASAAELFASFPNILGGAAFRSLVSAIAGARRSNRSVILALGAHVIKCGLGPLVIDLMKRGIVTGVAMNGAGPVHDFEVACAGVTSEDVSASLASGAFGVTRETGQFYSRAAARAVSEQIGLGAALGAELHSMNPRHENLSVLAAASRLSMPLTVHVAIGTDVAHLAPEMDGAALGEATYRDFKILCSEVENLAGGVFVNLGSAVILPEVFLKAVSAACNVGADLSTMTTANLDMIQHYRPKVNVVERPPGSGIALTGQHEILLPLLRLAVLVELARKE